ncbi:hypothetical protein ACA910_015124 [Epithemia clementina (nom. ined.)]
MSTPSNTTTTTSNGTTALLRADAPAFIPTFPVSSSATPLSHGVENRNQDDNDQCCGGNVASSQYHMDRSILDGDYYGNGNLQQSQQPHNGSDNARHNCERRTTTRAGERARGRRTPFPPRNLQSTHDDKNKNKVDQISPRKGRKPKARRCAKETTTTTTATTTMLLEKNHGVAIGSRYQDNPHDVRPPSIASQENQQAGTPPLVSSHHQTTSGCGVSSNRANKKRSNRSSGNTRGNNNSSRSKNNHNNNTRYENNDRRPRELQKQGADHVQAHNCNHSQPTSRAQKKLSTDQVDNIAFTSCSSYAVLSQNEQRFIHGATTLASSFPELVVSTGFTSGQGGEPVLPSNNNFFGIGSDNDAIKSYTTTSNGVWSKASTEAIKKGLEQEEKQQQQQRTELSQSDLVVDKERPSTLLSGASQVPLTLLSTKRSMSRRVTQTSQKPQQQESTCSAPTAALTPDTADQDLYWNYDNIKEPNQRSNNEKDSDPLLLSTSKKLLQRRRLNMTRLRDRWWEVLRNLPVPPLNHQGDSNKSGPDRLDDDEDSVDSGNVSLVSLNGSGNRFLYNESDPSSGSSFTHTTDQVDSPYLDNPLAVHEAIRRNDEIALRELLKSKQHLSNKVDEQGMSPLHLAVYLHRPQLLRILLLGGPSMPFNKNAANKEGKTSSSKNSPFSGTALHMAVSNGYEDCVSIFVDYNIAILLSKNEHTDDTPLHLACSSNASVGILQQCLKRMDNSMTAKVMSQRNKLGQTPLHIACTGGRVDLVEAILTNCSYSLLSKLLSVQDAEWQTPLLAAVASGSVDVVMGLLMWKGNNHKRIQEGGAKGHCALSWAVRARDVEMTLLLLEFNDSSSVSQIGSNSSSSSQGGYNLVHALHVAVRMVQKQTAPCDSVQLELIRVLTDAGANPYSSETPSGQAALVIATQANQEQVIQIMLRSYDKYLANARSARRRDPLLQKQPESFFRGSEQQEESERVASIREALLLSMFYAWTSESASLSYYACALALFQSSVQLDATCVERLKHALQKADKTCLSDSSIVGRDIVTQEASYFHPTGAFDENESFTKSRDQEIKNKPDPGLFWSLAMTQCQWMPPKSSVSCEWLRTLEDKTRQNHKPTFDVELTSTDGDRFLAHSTILCSKSGKLDAAIRFERMARGDTENDNELVRLQLPVTTTVCQLVLQHFYHGSMIGPFPTNHAHLVDELSSALDLAEQYLCPNLAQEVEMRLLSFDPRRCHCCHCSFRNDVGSSNGMIACTYVSTGPSLCIQPETALDVLALALHFEGGVGSSEYYLLVSFDELTRPSWKAPDSVQFIVYSAMEQLRGVAASYILRSFTSVTRSEAFSLHYEIDSKGSDKTQREALLRTCLEKVAAIPLMLPKPSENEKGNKKK